MKSNIKNAIFLAISFGLAESCLAQETKNGKHEAFRREMAIQLAEETKRDEKTLRIWENQLKKFDPPFDDQEFFKVGTRLRRLSDPNSFITPKSHTVKLRKAYRRKLISDPRYVDWWVSMINEARKTVEMGGSWTVLKGRSELAVDILRDVRTEESVRAIGEFLSDTRGSIREDPYPYQREHDYWSLAGTAVSALNAMDLEDPPQVKDERSYRWPETLIEEWQAWWAEVESGKREIRFRDKDREASKVETRPDSARLADRRDAVPDRSDAPDASPQFGIPPWIGWTALGVLGGLVALYLYLRQYGR